METTLDRIEHDVYAGEPEGCTTIGDVSYDGCWAASGALEIVVEVDWIKNNPINRVDPEGTITVFMQGWGGITDVLPSWLWGREPDKADYPDYNWVDEVFLSHQTGLAEAAIKKKIPNPKQQCEPIILIGHSKGGNSIYFVADSLVRQGYTVDLVASLDPIGLIGLGNPLVANRKIKLIWNWFQTVSTPGGHQVVGATREVMNATGMFGTGVLGPVKNILRHTEIYFDRTIANEIKTKADEIIKGYTK